MEVELVVGEGSNVGHRFDQSDTRGEERAPEAKANITTTGRLYRAARRYACMRGTYASPALSELSKCIGGATALPVSLVACCTGLGSAWSRRSYGRMDCNHGNARKAKVMLSSHEV